MVKSNEKGPILRILERDTWYMKGLVDQSDFWQVWAAKPLKTPLEQTTQWINKSHLWLIKNSHVDVYIRFSYGCQVDKLACGEAVCAEAVNSVWSDGQVWKNVRVFPADWLPQLRFEQSLSVIWRVVTQRLNSEQMAKGKTSAAAGPSYGIHQRT